MNVFCYGMLIGCSALFVSTPALGEGVGLLVAARGATIQGEGWLFRDPSTGYCGVVTAAHVVSSGGAVTIVAAGRQQGVGKDVQILSPTDPDGQSANAEDIALMRVEGGLVEEGCTTATLGATDMSGMLNRSKRGMIEQVEGGADQKWMEVEFLEAQGADPHLLTVRVRNPADAITPGYSGSPIVQVPEDRIGGGVRQLPLAMITAVNGGLGEAVRFDEIQRLVQRALVSSTWAQASRKPITRPAAGSALPARLVSWDGDTSALNCPATNAVDPTAQCGWRATPAQGRESLAIVLAPSGPVTSHVALRILAGASSPVSISIETTAAAKSDDWVWIKTVSASAGDTVIDFLPTVAERLRVSFSVKSGDTTEVRVLEVR